MVIRAPRPRGSSASAETFSARRVRVLVAYGAGLRWRSIGVLVGEVGVVVAIMALVPGFPFKQLAIGFVLGSITMAVTLAVGRADDPLVHGRWAERWSVQALRKVKGWLVIENVPFDGVDVDHVAITPCGVLAVETKFHNRLSGALAVEVHGRDLAAARAGAAKVRLLLRSFKLADVAVTPVLIVWGAGRPPLPNGYRRDGDVVVLDGRHPAVWAHLFDNPQLSIETRRLTGERISAFVASRADYESHRQRSASRTTYTAFRAGIRDTGASRKQIRALTRAARIAPQPEG